MATTYSIQAHDTTQYQGVTGQVTPYIFDVGRSGTTTADFAAVDIPWNVTGLININGSEFVGGVLPSGTLHFNSGTLEIDVKGGSVVGADATFLVALGVQNAGTGSGINSGASGGIGITQNDYIITSGGGTLSFNYEMYTIPDRADVLVNGTTVRTTGGAVSGTGTFSYPGLNQIALDTGDDITVIMSGYDPSTAWVYTIDYAPGITQSVQAQAVILAAPDNSSVQWQTSTSSTGNWTSTSPTYSYDDNTGSWSVKDFPSGLPRTP